MLERRSPDGQQPDDFYTRSLSALDRTLAAYRRNPDAHVQDIGQAEFRRNEFARYIEGDARLSWEDVMLASAAFSRTLRNVRRHPFEDDAFVAFLIEQAVYAAGRDGIVVDNAAILQPQLPGMEADVIDVQAQVESVVRERTAEDRNKYEVKPLPLPERRFSSPVNEPEQTERRILLKWVGLGAVIALTGSSMIRYLDYLDAEFKRLHPFEVEHRLTSELTPLSRDAKLQFAYPQIKTGWDFINKYGTRATVTHIPSEDYWSGRSLQVAIPWDNSAFPSVKKTILQGIFVTDYTDPSGRLVPKIKYSDSKGQKQEYALIGHLTEPEGSYSREHPDIIEIRGENNNISLYVSMVVEEVQERGRDKKEKVIKITTLEKTPKTS